MRMYIANPTDQSQTICYRVDFEKDGARKDTNRRFQPASQQEIKPGTQAQLGSDMHKNAIEDIVRQLSPYGLLHVNDLSRAPNCKVPYIYNLDLAVPLAAMQRIRLHNAGVMTEEGRARRAAAAVASNELVQTAVQNHFAANGIDAAPADSTLVAFEQLDQSEAGERRIEEGYEVVPPGKRGPRSGNLADKRRGRRGRR